MLLRIIRARAIKEGVIRFNVELVEVDDGQVDVSGEYEVSLDVSEMVLVDIDAGDAVIDINEVKYALTQSIQHLQLTAEIARQLQGLDWKLDSEVQSEVENERTSIDTK